MADPIVPVRLTDLSQMAANPAAAYALMNRSSLLANQTAQDIAAFTSGFMPPGMPISPLEPFGTPARRFDYPTSINVQYTPRAGLTNFTILKNFAAWDPVRYCIEERKNRIKARKWAIAPLDAGEGKTGKYDHAIQKLTQYWSYPDGENTFDLWLGQLLEDSFLYDAATIFRWPTRDGKATAQHVAIDGKTISPLLDITGRRPRPPLPAYRQIIKGIVWDNFTSDQLLYAVRNPSNDSAYGMSEVEWLLLVINIALRRDTFDLSYYVEGNAPQGFLGAPEGWTPDQIKTFQAWFDSVLAGNAKTRSRVQIVPGGFDFQRWIEREEDKYVKFSEFVVRRACAIFHVAPDAYTAQVNRATAQISDERQAESADEQLMQWISSIITREIQAVQGYPDLCFAFVSERESNRLNAAQADKIEIESGQRSLDELRSEKGLSEIGIPPFVLTGQGPVYLRGSNPEYQAKYKKFFEELDAEPEPETIPSAKPPMESTANTTEKPTENPLEKPPVEQPKAALAQALADLKKWRKVALRCAKDGKAQRRFESEAIPSGLAEDIRNKISDSTLSETIAYIFDLAAFELEKADVSEVQQIAK